MKTSYFPDNFNPSTLWFVAYPNFAPATNYGVSCQECQAVLEGYGFGGWFGSNLTGRERCIHGAWYTISDTEEECLYCHRTRERAQKAN